MEYVNNAHARRWVDGDTPGYEYIDMLVAVYDPSRVRARVITT
jgi:hypothetical protein